MTRRLLLAALTLTACRQPQPQAPKTILQYQLSGTILRLVPKSKIAIIKHGPITADNGKVWMEAMTMEFPVKDPAEFARLKTGQRIKATVHQNDADLSYWIAGITELPPPAKP